MRASGGFLVDDEADRIWELADRMEAICRRRLDEDLAWVDYLRSEAGFVSGEWDLVLAAGLRAIELSERNAYHRAAVRTWHVLLPIAGARGDRELVEHAHRWLVPRRDSLPDSPYARVMIWAFERQFIEAGAAPAKRSGPDATAALIRRRPRQSELALGARGRGSDVARRRGLRFGPRSSRPRG